MLSVTFDTMIDLIALSFDRGNAHKQIKEPVVRNSRVTKHLAKTPDAVSAFSIVYT